MGAALRFRMCSAILLLITANSAFLAAQASSSAASIDIEHSTMTVHVYRSGLFSFAGDNHEIQAPVASGMVNESARSVELRVDVRRMRVLDPNLSADKRSQVQEKMLSPDVLDPDRYPEISFRSTAVEEKNSNNVSVRGDLILHGQTRPINVNVSRAAHHYRGSATIKQTDFGIKPISIGGGTIKVKDEVRIDFDIVTLQP
jgi:polyisoprenoid-binding protein YceI